VNLGPVGIWTYELDTRPAAQMQAGVVELESLGYGAVWLPDGFGREPLANAGLALAASDRITVATGVASIHSRGAWSMAAAQLTLTEAYPDRFLLGLGVSHGPLVEGLRGGAYGRPLAAMSDYLDAMDEASFPFAAPAPTPGRRVLGALGPKMMALAGARADGAHPYLATVEHTASARAILGLGPLLAPQVAVMLEEAPGRARQRGRAFLSMYLGLPNYQRHLARLGFGPDDLADGGSDRLIDAVVGWGPVDDVAKRVQAHLTAGADHVAVQVIGPVPGEPPLDEWRALAPALVQPNGTSPHQG